MTDQLSEADLEKLTKEHKYEEIDAARVAGRLDQVLGIERHHPPADAQWTSADLTAMTKAGRADEIEAARLNGQLQSLLVGTDPTNS